MEKIFFARNLLAKVKKYNYSYDYDSGGGLGFLVGFFWFLFWIGMYIYGALTLMLIAKKSNTSGSWMAWVPILNLYLMVKASGKSMIWLVLFLLPFVNIIAMVVVWAAISERLGKPGWWGILMLVPVANFIIMGILAFSKNPGASAVSTPKKVTKKPKSAVGPTCSGCGASISSDDAFCPECGKKLSKQQESSKSGFCSKCGAKMKPSDKFCPECGAKL